MYFTGLTNNIKQFMFKLSAVVFKGFCYMIPAMRTVSALCLLIFAAMAAGPGLDRVWAAEKPVDQLTAIKENITNKNGDKKFSAAQSYATASVIMLENDFISLAVSPSGRFTLGTTGGNPDLETDDNKKMLYGHPEPGTSYTTVKIDGTNYYYGLHSDFGGEVVVNPYNESGSSNISEFRYGGVHVRQILTFVRGISSEREDTLEIRYRISNLDTVSHTIGLRIMMDTMLGENDAAPFKIPGLGDVHTETDFTGSEIPEYWQAVDNLLQPGVVGQGTNATWQLNRPDRFVIANWSSLEGTMWDYTCRLGQDTGDSAVGIYWNPVAFSPGETKEFVTYYGLSEFSSELSKSLAVNLTGPARLNWEVDRYVPNPFTITAYITNNTGQVANNVVAQMSLPEGLTFYTGYQEKVELGNINVGETKQAIWKVYAGEQGQETTLEYKLTVTSDNTEPTEVKRSVVVPESPFYQEPEQPVDPAFVVHREIGLNLEQETSSRPHQIPEIINVTVNPKQEAGVYELYVSDYFVDTSKGGQAVFYWTTEDGYFEDQELENYRRVIFHANPGTAGQLLLVEVQLGDCLGNVAYYPVIVEGAGEPINADNNFTLTARFLREPGLLRAWDTYPIVYEAVLKDKSGNVIPGTRTSIYYSTGDSDIWIPVVTDLIDRTRYNWIVPDINSQSVRLKLVAANGNFTAEAISNSFIVTPDLHVKGQVLDANNQGIEGATVTVDSQQAITDLAGNYVINRLNPGSYTVTVNKEGVTFIRNSRNVQLTVANPSRIVNFHAR